MTDDEQLPALSDHLVSAMRSICDALHLDVLTCSLAWPEHIGVIRLAADAVAQCVASVDELEVYLGTLRTLVDDEAATS